MTLRTPSRARIEAGKVWVDRLRLNDLYISIEYPAGVTRLPVFVVDQTESDGTIDESKVMLGYQSGVVNARCLPVPAHNRCFVWRRRG